MGGGAATTTGAAATGAGVGFAALPDASASEVTSGSSSKLIIDLLLVLGTENPRDKTRRVILSLVFGLEDPDSHARGRWKRANLNEALELVFSRRTCPAFRSSAPKTHPGGEPMRASVAAQVHPIALCEETSRDVVMKYGCK